MYVALVFALCDACTDELPSILHSGQDIVISSLANDAAVESVYDELLKATRKGHKIVFVETSTVYPDVTSGYWMSPNRPHEAAHSHSFQHTPPCCSRKPSWRSSSCPSRTASLSLVRAGF